jgi:hypothetical protein
MPQVSNHALERANYYFGPLVVHDLLSLEHIGTGKAPSCRMAESHIDLLKPKNPSSRFSATKLDLLFNSWKNPNDGLLGIIEERKSSKSLCFGFGVPLQSLISFSRPSQVSGEEDHSSRLSIHQNRCFQPSERSSRPDE